jgi:hypothetical protein
MILVSGYDATNMNFEIQRDCGAWIDIELWTWTWCGIIVENATLAIAGNLATFYLSGYQSFPDANIQFKASITLQLNSENVYVPNNLHSEARPTFMVADNETTPASIIAYTNDEFPNDYCSSTALKFTIENPIDGVTINGNNTSTVTSFLNGRETAILAWDGGNLPGGEYTVSIRIEAFGLSTVQSVKLISQKPCPILSASESVIRPGESSVLSIMKRMWDGTVVAYPAYQTFMVRVNDENLGRIRSGSGSEGSFVVGQQPFEFIAADSIAFDSSEVEIGVVVVSQTQPPGGGVEVVESFGEVSEDTPSINNKQPNSKISALTSKMESRNYQIENERLNSLLINKKVNDISQISIINRDKQDTLLAHDEKAIPTGKQNTKSNLEKPISLSLETTDCNPKVTLTIVKEEPELVVIYPTDNLMEQKIISNSPSMPDIVPSAQLINYNGGDVNFQWNLRVEWVGPDGRKFNDNFPGTTESTNSEVSSWKIDWSSKTRGGDKITLDVTAIAGGVKYKKTVNLAFKILGLNPSPADVRNELTIEEQVVAYKESRFRQFINNNDFPIFGPLHGYGLMQLDYPRATDEQVWNWKSNRSAGKKLFNEKKNLAKSYSARIIRGKTWFYKNNKQKQYDPIGQHFDWYPCAYSNANALNENEILKEAFQRYQGGNGNVGVYWRWKPYISWLAMSPGRWVKVATSSYGDNAWEIYNAISNHNTFPNDWN